jgi:hypothetical protein
MTATRVALAAGILFLAVFVIIMAFALHAGIPVLVVLALFGLVACGNLLYGRHSHGAKAVARKRPAQQAHDHAAALAADARRAGAEAAKRGERYCPLDPAQTHSGAHAQSATNGHAPAPHTATPPPPQSA